MTSTHLQQWIEHPEELNKDTLYELRTLVARYPYFQSARLLFLKNLYLLHDIEFGAELRKSVLYVADRRVLFRLIEGDRYALKRTAAASIPASDADEEPGVDRTLFLIDSFLANAPDEQPQQTELDYSMDYTAFLMQQEEEENPDGNSTEVPRLRGQELIDGFLNKADDRFERADEMPPASKENPWETFAEETEKSEHQETTAPDGNENGTAPLASPQLANEELDEGCFTETLAKIYIKQHRYEKALEIIKKLSLKYPKKNAYFADQIRFLEKLIINAKSK